MRSRFRCSLHAFEQIDDPHPQRLRNEVQAGEGDVHSAILESSHLCSMKTRQVRELVLRDTALHPKLSNPLAQALLNFLPLQQLQFRGILLKRILLIRRGWITVDCRSQIALAWKRVRHARCANCHQIDWPAAPPDRVVGRLLINRGRKALCSILIVTICSSCSSRDVFPTSPSTKVDVIKPTGCLPAAISQDGEYLRVTNNDVRTWTNVFIDLNDDDKGEKGFEADAPPIDPGNTLSFQLKEFVRDDGLRFDMDKYKIVEIALYAREGKYIRSGCDPEELKKLSNMLHDLADTDDNKRKK